MTKKRVGRTAAIAAACQALVLTTTASAAIKSVTSQVTAEVHQISDHGGNLQSDIAQTSFPGQTATPPAVARARLDQPDGNGGLNGSAQVAAIFTQPIFPLFLQPPSDIGLDVAGFSNDHLTHWTASGAGVETRTVVMSVSELSGAYQPGDIATLRSRLVISGVMLIASVNGGQDLTGASVKFQFSVTQRRPNRGDTTPVFGSMTVNGGPNGTISTHGEGIMALQNPAVVDFNGVIPEIPQVKAILFAGINFPYEYEIAVEESFELQLVVGADIVTRSDGVGCAAIFGTPQVGLGEIFQRTRNSDGGVKLQEAIAAQVDTTGAAYVEPAASPAPSLCGFLGGNAGLLGFATIAAMTAAKRRLRSRPVRGD